MAVFPARAVTAIEFNASAFTIAENAAPLTVRVVRRGEASGTSTVQFTTSNATARAGVDFTATNGVLEFAPGETIKTFSVALLDDAVLKTNRYFHLQLAGVTGGVLGTQSNATVTLLDDEFPAALDPTFQPGSGADNDIFALALTSDARILAAGQFVNSWGARYLARLLPDGRADAAFTVSSNAPNAPVYAVAVQPDGRVLLGGDFTTLGSVSIPYVARLQSNGLLDTSFTPPAINNSLRALALQPDGKVLIAGRFTTVGGQSRSRIARLNADGSLDPTFDPGTGANDNVRALALQPDGRVLIGGQFTMVAGVTRNFVARLMTDGSLDTSFDPGVGPDDEVRSIAVQPDGKILLGGDFELFDNVARSSVARLNTNGVLDLDFDAGPSENDLVRVVAPGPEGKVWIGGLFSTAGGAERRHLALLGTNGQADAFHPGLFENEVFSVVTQPDGYTLVGGDFTAVSGVPLRRLARLRMGPPPSATLSWQAVNGAADEPGGELTFGVVRANEFASTAQVGFFTADGTAAAGADYVAQSGMLTFEPHESAKLISVSIVNDSWTEGTENFSIVLTNPAAPATLGTITNATLTIRDDDSGFEFAADTFTGSEPAGTAMISVRRGGTGSDTVSVDFLATSGTATAGADFMATNGTLVFLPGDIEKAFTVKINNDGVSEGIETVTLTLTNPSPGTALGPRRNATLQIDDIDSRIEFTYASQPSEPADAVYIYLGRSGVAGVAASVTVTTADGSATAGADYGALNATFTFAPGERSRWFTVPLFNDGLVEGVETFTLSLSAPGPGAALGANSNLLLSIQDNDRGIGFVETNVVTSESFPSVQLTVQRFDDGTNSLSVEYATSDGTARAGVNYVASSGTPTLASSSGTNTIFIPLLDECGLMGTRTFTVALRNPSVSASLGTNSVAVITIEGNDQPGRRDKSFFRLPPPVYIGRAVPRLAVQPDGKVVGGIEFEYEHNGEFVTPVFRLLPNGAIDRSFNGSISPGNSHLITALVLQANGQILAAGWWIVVEQSYYWFYRLRRNGTIDPSFQPPSDYFGLGTGGLTDVSCLALQADGKVLVGRDWAVRFDPVNAGVARLMPDGSPDPSFNPGTGARYVDWRTGVEAIALQTNGGILVGGFFTSFNGVESRGLVRLLPNGALDPTFNTGDGPLDSSGAPAVTLIRVQSDQRIVIAGPFTSVDDTTRTGLARLHENGALDRTFAPIISGGEVRAMILQRNGRIVIGGNFTNVQGQLRAGLARLNSDGSLDTTFDPAPHVYEVAALALQPDDHIVVSSSDGLWRVFGDPLPRIHPIAIANGTTRLRVQSRPGASYTVEISDDLQHWSAFETRVATDCALEFVDSALPRPARYYRILETRP